MKVNYWFLFVFLYFYLYWFLFVYLTESICCCLYVLIHNRTVPQYSIISLYDEMYLTNTWLCNVRKLFSSFLVECRIKMSRRQLELSRARKHVLRIFSKRQEARRKHLICAWCHPNHRVLRYRPLLYHL